MKNSKHIKYFNINHYFLYFKGYTTLDYYFYIIPNICFRYRKSVNQFGANDYDFFLYFNWGFWCLDICLSLLTPQQGE